MKHSFTFTTKRYLRESDKSITKGKLQYVQRAGKIPWREALAYTSLLLFMLIIGQVSQLVYRMIPLVAFLATAHVLIYLLKSLRFLRIAKKIRRPILHMKQEFKGFFKIKLRFDDQLEVILYKENSSEIHSIYKRSDLQQVTPDYLHLFNEKHELIIPKSLFVLREYENVIAYLNEPAQQNPNQEIEDLNELINQDTPVMTQIMYGHLN